MNSLLLFCVAAAITMVSCASIDKLTPEMQEKMMEVQNACMAETGASDEMIMDAYAGNFSDDPKLTDQLICVAKRGGIIDADGIYHKEVLKEKLMMFVDDGAKVDAALDKCVIEKPDIKETVKESTKCLFAKLN